MVGGSPTDGFSTHMQSLHRGSKHTMTASRQITERVSSGVAAYPYASTSICSYLTREKKDTVSSVIRHAVISSADRHSDVHGCAFMPYRPARAKDKRAVGYTRQRNQEISSRTRIDRTRWNKEGETRCDSSSI